MKYLFNARFDDGTVYQQNEIDASQHTPQKSSFYDVLELQREGKRLIEFTLTNGTKKATVNLEEGSFVIDDYIRIPRPEGKNLSNFRLIYFRRNTLLFGGASGHTVVFHLGWQANDENGHNYQSVMEIA